MRFTGFTGFILGSGGPELGKCALRPRNLVPVLPGEGVPGAVF